MKHLLAFCAVALLGSVALRAETASAPATEKPNVIFILADDLGWGDLGAYGNPYVKTPNLDRLAARGVSFRQFYVSSPVCSPSRATFLTGRFPAELSLHGHISGNAESNRQRGIPDWMDADQETVADLLRQTGYTTAHIGKWHLGPIRGKLTETAPAIADYGYDFTRTRYDYGKNEFPGSQDLAYDPYFRAATSGLFVDSALDFIRANRDRPFYVDLWTLIPHAPLNPTPDEIAVYAETPIDLEQFSPAMRRYAEAAPDANSQLPIYAAAVTGLDQAIGKLLDELDRLGLSEKTLILFASDNGPEDYHIDNAHNAGMGSPGNFRGRKRSLYEGGIRVPLIVSWPGHVPEGVIDEDSVVASVDFLPTLAALAGTAPANPDLPGENALPAFTGAGFQRHNDLFWEWRFSVVGDRAYQPPQLAIRDGDWKLLCDPDGSHPELYALNDDPEETRNLAAAHPDVVARLTEKVLAWSKALPGA